MKIKFSLKHLLFSVLCFSTFGVFAQNALSLEDCVNFAQTNNPQIRMAQLQVSDADWRVKESLATGLPQVSAGVTYTGFLQRGGLPSGALSFGPSGPVTPPSSLTDNFTSAQITGLGEFLGALFQSDPDAKIFFNPVHSVSGKVEASQLIFNNSYLLAKKAARYYRDYMVTQLETTRQTLRNQVTDTYLPALLISDNLAVFDKNIANLEKMLAETKAVNKAGFAEQLDVDRLELSIANLKSERGNLARQREIVVNALKMVMGMPIAQELALSDDTEKLMAQNSDVDLITPANFMNRAEYQALLKGRDLAALNVDLYRKPFMPTVAGFVQYAPGLQGGFGTKGSDGFNNWYFIGSAVAGVSVSVTLYDGGGNKAKKERAIIQAQTIEAQKSMLENGITLEVENARKQYMSAAERVKNQQASLDLARRIYETTQTKFKAGVGSSFELVSAEQGLTTAQQGLTQARFDLLTAKMAIKKALGN